ncbi:MAG: PEP-CTERM sorting domain-containing protein [Phycisphaerae bacterium]|nr:PEP-CTERM sorting domain-containing protein [Phycisphaerae bacterium]
MEYHVIAVLMGLGLAVGEALGAPDPVGDQFNPYGLPPGSAPDLVEVSVIRDAGNLSVTLECDAPVYPADDFAHWDLRILGRIDFGVGDDGSAADSYKSQWYSDPSYLDVLAFLSLNDVADGQIPLYDDGVTVLAYLPISFESTIVSVVVPEALLPDLADGFDVLVHDIDEMSWDVFPNGPGHADVVPEPSMLLLLVAGLLGWRRKQG